MEDQSAQSAPTPPVTVQDLDNLVAELRAAREEKDRISALLTEQNKVVVNLEAKAAAFLKELGRDNFASPHGTVYMRRTWSWTLPKADEDKLAFRAWLRERGIEDQYLTVHSASFNSLCNAEREAAEKNGEFASIPGVQDPKMFESVNFRRN